LTSLTLFAHSWALSGKIAIRLGVKKVVPAGFLCAGGIYNARRAQAVQHIMRLSDVLKEV
jgi:hypothetical protein